MSILAPPQHPADEPEALIREARERQRRRQALAAAVVALAAAVGLSVWAAIPGRGGGGSRPAGGPRAGAARGVDVSGRVRIAEVGSSGGVTWALNGHGLWLTADGGRTWRLSTPPGLSRLGAYRAELWQRIPEVTFLDRRHGRLVAFDVGGLPRRAHQSEFEVTNDGGRTWHRSLPHDCCGEFSFVTGRVGFFVGRQGGLYGTRNGGASWRHVGGRFYGAPLTFLDANRGVAMLDGGFLQTSDGGRHWMSPLLSGRPAAAGNPTVTWAPIQRVGDRLVLLAGHNFGKGSQGGWRVIPYASDDGGASWTARPVLPRWLMPYAPRNGHGTDWSAASADVWFVTAGRELGVTTDAGQTWNPVRPVDLRPGWRIASIDFTSPTVGWAIFAGSGRRVLMRTTDGGLRWQAAGPRVRRHEKKR